MFTDHLDVRTQRRAEFVDLTARLSAWIESRGLREGMLTLYCPHTTAGVTINEGYDPDVVADFLSTLEGLVPRDERYRHAEGNSDSHIKASLMGSSARVPVRGGKLDLGRWQAVFLCEFDGPRSRRCRLYFEGEESGS